MKRVHQGIGMTSQRTRDRLAGRLAEEDIQDQRVLEVIRRVPRHIFVEEALASRAYEDTALPIGYGQTISQPYVVAKMTELLLQGGELKKVLEVGTGCGYQTAVLSQLVAQVYSVERIKALVEIAQGHLRELGIRNVRVSHSDGSWGLDDRAPFDGILVAAAPETVPEALIEQLSINGRLVIPVGPPGRQDLMVITRTEEGIQQQVLDYVSFVPLLGGAC